ncbi:hypothetical protein Xbed_02308 [Xenorhabdus beddingii]|uniref:Uncharacterized protein n=1 Tax=Xenorhabdus beddingii TaxID=40578 RepID=A0A1Y2SL13_9GAMM|nr:hypothetical protein [Xenorhabdus beddingii]OTA19454.1 hypothetical protein Xbed_02308 [Xenorhabdus beddingii]
MFNTTGLSTTDTLPYRMALVVNSNEHIIAGFVDGVLSVPINLGYLAYDMLDTDSKYEKDNDKIRLMYLIKNGGANKESIYEIISTVLDKYISSLSDEQKEKLWEKIIAQQLGKIGANSLIFGHMNKVLISRIVSRMIFSISMSFLLTAGAMQSRAVYSSRELLVRNPKLYWELRSKGDLDLLYVFVESYVKPFEEAENLKKVNQVMFDQVFEQFLPMVKD